MISGCSQGSHFFEVVFIRDRRQATFTIVAEVNGYFFLFSQCPCHCYSFACDELSRLDYQPLFGKMSPHSSPRGGSKTAPGRRRNRAYELSQVGDAFSRRRSWPIAFYAPPENVENGKLGPSLQAPPLPFACPPRPSR